MFEKYFGWSFAMGRVIIEKCGEDKGKKLLKRLIFDIRAEETPGRFLEKLSERFIEYRTNPNIQADVNVLPEIMQGKWHADKFYYLKSAILAGFLNALPSEGEKIE